MRSRLLRCCIAFGFILGLSGGVVGAGRRLQGGTRQHEEVGHLAQQRAPLVQLLQPPQHEVAGVLQQQACDV